TGLRTRLYLEHRMTGQCRHFQFCTQGCLRECDLEIVDYIIAIAKEMLVFEFVDDDQRIACGATAAAGVTLTGQREIISFANAGRNFHAERRLFLDATFTIADIAALANRFARSLTRRAYRNIHELPETH